MKDFDPHHSDADTHQKNTGKDILTKNVSRKVQTLTGVIFTYSSMLAHII